MSKWIWRVLKWGALGAVLYLIVGFVRFKMTYASFRHDSPFEEAHGRAVRSFVDGAGFGVFRFRKKEHWNDHSVNLDGDTYEVRTVQLIGATAEEGPRYFESFREPPRKEDVLETPHRILTAREQEIIGILRRKEVAYVKEVVIEDREDEEVDTRVIAPLFARENCLKCHEAEVGELLGAFDYRLSRKQE